jgi:hypothetical protein
VIYLEYQKVPLIFKIFKKMVSSAKKIVLIIFLEKRKLKELECLKMLFSRNIGIDLSK